MTKRWVAISALGLLLASLVITPTAAQGPGKDAPPPPPVPLLMDADNNKLFDNLEERLQSAAASDKFDVIVQFADVANEAAYAAIERSAGPIAYNAKWDVALQGFSASMTKAAILALSKNPLVKQIELDVQVSAFLSTAKRDTGVNKARTDFGVSGGRDASETTYSKTDVVVAVLDTGIHGGHVDLDGGKIIGWRDEINFRTTPYDDQGHGTHVASIVAGTGEGNSAYGGVAPGVALVGIKVLDSQGNGTTTQIINGVNWMISNKATYGIRIGNMSLGAAGCSNGTDSISTAVNNAVDNGIIMVVAAGNEGPGSCTIGAPAAAAKAITVGAAYDIGELGWAIAEFSSRGPTADGRAKPDIVTPGRNITAAAHTSSTGYVTQSGTSMATPFMAGVIALMLDANYALTDSGVKNIIYNSANYEDRGPAGKDNEFGFGLNLAYNSIKAAGGWTTGTFDDGQNKGYASGSITTSGAQQEYSLSVTSTAVPVAVTMIRTSGSGDLDLYVYNPSGTLVGKSEGTTRQELVRFTPTVTGTYKIRVKSYSGTGAYFLDVSYK